MTPPPSRREREILDVLYRLGRGSVADVRSGLADPPSYSAVRTLLGLMVDKGHVTHEREGNRYIYTPTTAPEVAGRKALSRLVHTFFGGSIEGVVSTLLDGRDVSPETLDTLADLVDQARKDPP